MTEASTPLALPVHKLFEQYPLVGETAISTGLAPTPYHIYDGYALLVGGTANLDAARALTAREQVTPVTSTDDRAFMAVWIVDATAASLGPHSELQIALFVTRKPLPPIEPSALTVLQLLLLRKDVQMLCCHLWNNTAQVVAYNKEHLGLPAQLGRSEFEYDGNGDLTAFSFWQSDQILCRGRAHPHRSTPLNTILPMLQALGWSGFWQVLTQPWAASAVMNPVGPVLAENQLAPTYAAGDRLVVHLYDARTDAFALVPSPYAELEFQPQFVESIHGLKFVYLDPVTMSSNEDGQI
jgi:hypothetical protein